MIAGLNGKRALIISDNRGLSRAITINLSELALEVATLNIDPAKVWYGEAPSKEFDLIVLALSSPSSEPVVMLAKASVIEYIGKIPLLIISDRPFRTDPGSQITHLDFPFGIDKLRQQVSAALGSKIQVDKETTGTARSGKDSEAN
jgi:hypothetical protein